MENQQLDLNKQLVVSINDSITKLATQITNTFKDGLVSGKDTLKLYAGVKFLKDKMELITKDDKIKDIVLTEFDKFGEKKVDFDTFSVSKRNYGKYDYSDINHPAIDVQNHINKVMDLFVEDAKNRSKVLYQNMSKSVVVDDIVAIKKESIIQLQQQINEMFNLLLELFDSDQEVLNIQIKPAKYAGSESIVVTQKDSKVG